MQSRLNSFLLACLTGLVLVCFAGVAAGQPAEAAAEESAEVSAPSFPYIAGITGNNVYVRSGPGSDYYPCGKLNKTERVKVVATKYKIWSQIVPPASTFSWISKQYVAVDPQDATIGIVTGDAVRVRAGSADGNPIHSTTEQLKLDKDSKVKLIGQGHGDYYKIVPPAGAYLWVSTEYTQLLGDVAEGKMDVEPQAETSPESAGAVSDLIDVETKRLRDYYALEKQIQAHRAGPIDQQDYADIKKALAAIAGDKQAGKAARYSQFAIQQIECFELALKIDEVLGLQDAQFKQVQQRIEKARVANLEKVADLGAFAVIGRFQTSTIYSPDAELKYWRITDDSGKTICYALPTGPASEMNLAGFTRRKVGLVGTIQPHLETAGALVRFTEIAELKQ
jgi:uncharacterized protein YgiM (DUF1202 family)